MFLSHTIIVKLLKMFNIDFYKDHEITTLSSHHAFLSPVVLLPFTLLILHWSRAFVNPLSVNASLFPQSSIRDPQSAIRNASHQSAMLLTNSQSVTLLSFRNHQSAIRNQQCFSLSAIINPQCFSPIRNSFLTVHCSLVVDLPSPPISLFFKKTGIQFFFRYFEMLGNI